MRQFTRAALVESMDKKGLSYTQFLCYTISYGMRQFTRAAVVESMVQKGAELHAVPLLQDLVRNETVY
jgi:hypothetical protein